MCVSKNDNTSHFLLNNNWIFLPFSRMLVPSSLRISRFSYSFGVKSCRPKALPHKPFWYICIAKSLSAEHIILSFAECIISCFESFVHSFGGSLFATFLLTTWYTYLKWSRFAITLFYNHLYLDISWRKCDFMI